MDIFWIMVRFLEGIILSILTAIFQAIGQAIAFIFPLSDSGHASIFQDFSSRYSGKYTELTGLIYIGIAIGIIIAFYKLFIKLTYEFFAGFNDLFHNRLDVNNLTTRRKFTYLTLIPFVFMLLYLIPIGDKGNIYQCIRMLSYDGNLLSEGICFVVSATLLLLASIKLTKSEKSKQFTLPDAVILGVAIFFTLPLAGLSLCATVLSVSVLLNVNKKAALRYFVAISAPILLVKGIVEVVACVTYINVFAGIIGVVLGAVFSFFACKFLIFFVKTYRLKYFSYYNYSLGVILVIVGVIEILAK